MKKIVATQISKNVKTVEVKFFALLTGLYLKPRGVQLTAPKGYITEDLIKYFGSEIMFLERNGYFISEEEISYPNVLEEDFMYLPSEAFNQFKYTPNQSGVVELVIEDLSEVFEWEVFEKYAAPTNIYKVLVSIIAEYMARILTRQTEYKLNIFLEQLYSRTFNNYYMPLVVLMRLDWLNEWVELEVVEEALQSSDIEMEIEVRDAINLKNYKIYSPKDYVSFLDEIGVEKGSILALFRRNMGNDRVDKSKFVIGTVESVSIVEVIDFNERDITVNVIPCTSSKAQKMREFMEIPESKKEAFLDLINPVCRKVRETFSMYSVGVEEKFGENSSFLLARFNPEERVEGEFLVDGEEKQVKLTAPQMVYSLLKDYNVEFNEGAFEKMYGKDSMIDLRRI